MRKFPAYLRKVQFVDTDMAGIVHFSTILRYVEEAEHFAMANAGVPPIDRKSGFPKVHMSCDYRSSLKFGDEAQIELTLQELGNRALTWSFAVCVGKRLAAEGTMVTAYVEMKGGALLSTMRDALSAES